MAHQATSHPDRVAETAAALSRVTAIIEAGAATLTPGEYATYRRVHPNTIYGWIRRRIIPVETHVGKVIRINVKAADKALSRFGRKSRFDTA